ncbi:hypothetical protein [Streptomyces sp. NPDC003832]
MSRTPVILVDDSVQDPHAGLWFAEPPGFLPLPLDALLPELGSAAADALRTAVAPLLESDVVDSVRLQFVAQVAAGQRLLAALRETGTVHCSIGLHRDDVTEWTGNRPSPLVSFFTVTWHEVATAPRGVTAARAAAACGGATHVEYLELPCGPVTLGESTLRPSAPRPEAVAPGLPALPLLQIRAYAPHPDCKRLAVLMLGTTAVARRAEYRTILRQIAESVSFESPLG